MNIPAFNFAIGMVCLVAFGCSFRENRPVMTLIFLVMSIGTLTMFMKHVLIKLDNIIQLLIIQL